MQGTRVASPHQPSADFIILTPQLAACLLPALQEIDAEALGEPWSSDQWLVDLPEKWLHSRLATVDGRPIAFVVTSRKAHGLHVHRIAVAPDWRGRGIGSALLRAVAESARATGSARVTLKVGRSNARALRLYQALGFTLERAEEDNACLAVPVAVLLATGAAP